MQALFVSLLYGKAACTVGKLNSLLAAKTHKTDLLYALLQPHLPYLLQPSVMNYEAQLCVCVS